MLTGAHPNPPGPEGPGGVRPGTARRAAVLGSPIEHSRSPVLHRAAYDALGLADWTYGRHAVGGAGEPTLPEFLAGCEDPAWVGLSLTMPLKEDALTCAASASEHARLLGAANTLLRREEGWYADSTDAYGARQALLEAGARGGSDALVLGAGATARSVLAALADLGCARAVLAVRASARPETVAVGEALGLTIEAVPLAELATWAPRFPVVVSTLPTGTALGLGGPVRLGEGTVLMDVVYGGWPTPLARWAQDSGARVVSGLPMLLHQACAQVQLMTGRAAPVEAMRAALAASTA